MTSEKLFSNQDVNTKRQIVVDVFKAISIIYMILTHVFEYNTVFFSGGDPGTVSLIIEAIRGSMGVTVFMVAMGMGFVFSNKTTPKGLFVKGLKLFILAYVLNFLRDALPYIIYGNINGNFEAGEYLVYVLLNVDIYHFAGLAIMFTALLKKLNLPIWGYGVVAVVMMIIADLIYFPAELPVITEYGLGLFLYTSESSCFPLLIWYIYPVIGMIIATLLKRVTDLDRWYRDIFLVGIGLLIVTAALHFSGLGSNSVFNLTDSHYRENLMMVIYNLGRILILAAIIHYLDKFIHSEKLRQVCIFLSKNLSEIYIVQWLIIGNLTHIFLCFQIPYWPYSAIIPETIVVTVIAAFVSIPLKKLLGKFWAWGAK